MKIIIENCEFPPGIGMSILKAKYGVCRFKALEDLWDSIPDLTFSSIVTDLRDVDSRRIAFRHLGVQRMLKEVDPVLVSREKISKKTVWVGRDGSLESREYEDAYELYNVDIRRFVAGMENFREEIGMRLALPELYFVKCRDTSTGREYVIWVDIRGIYMTNLPPGKRNNVSRMSSDRIVNAINPIQAIAWTIITDIEAGGIEAILRQGDCVLLRAKPGAKRTAVTRNLTEAEYRSLMTYES